MPGTATGAPLLSWTDACQTISRGAARGRSGSARGAASRVPAAAQPRRRTVPAPRRASHGSAGSRAGPDALLRATLEPYRAVGPTQQQPPPLDRAALELARADRNSAVRCCWLARQSGSPGQNPRNRAGCARTGWTPGPSSLASRRSSRRDRAPPAADPAPAPTACAPAPAARSPSGEQARQHALDVAVGDGDALSPKQKAAIAAAVALLMPGSVSSCPALDGKSPAPLFHHGLRAAADCARGCSSPGRSRREHILLRCRRERLHVGKRCRKRG